MLTPNYHKLYKLKPIYNIDKEELKEKYFKLSKKYHPDIVAIKYKSIIDGYNVLKDDYKRAAYMYNGEMKKLDSAFLSEILEIEEEIGNCDENRLKEIKKYIEESITECRKTYNNWESIAKWRYYERLKDKISNSE